LIVLGDLWHARDGCTEEVIAELAEWLNCHADTEVRLVIGNHDRSSGLPRVEHLQICDTIRLGDLYLQHEPPEGPVADRVHVVAGHLHPGCTVSGRGGQSYSLRCFWHTPQFTVLPAFGEMTGLARINPSPADRIFALADGDLIEIPAKAVTMSSGRSA